MSLRFEAGNVNPYVLSFAIRSSWLNQSNVFDKMVTKVQKALLLSSAFFPFFEHCLKTTLCAEPFAKVILVLSKYGFK